MQYGQAPHNNLVQQSDTSGDLQAVIGFRILREIPHTNDRGEAGNILGQENGIVQ